MKSLKNGVAQNKPLQTQIKEVKIMEEGPQSKDKSGGLFNLFGFGNNKKYAAVDDLDNRLDTLQISSKHVNGEQKNDNGILIERHEHNQFNRTYMPQIPNSLKVNDKPSLREQKEVDAIKNLISSYYNVVKNNISDSVPKTIITFLVNQSKHNCKNELVAAMYKEDLFDTLLAENSYIAQNRDECRKQLKMLKECLNILVEIDTKF